MTKDPYLAFLTDLVASYSPVEGHEIVACMSPTGMAFHVSMGKKTLSKGIISPVVIEDTRTQRLAFQNSSIYGGRESAVLKITHKKSANSA